MKNRILRSSGLLPLLAIGLALLASLGAPRRAPAEDLLRAGLLTPELIRVIRPELSLTDDQESRMQAIVTESLTAAAPLEQTMKERRKDLEGLLKQAGTTQADAEAALSRLMEAEGSVKQLRLRTLLSLRDVLTPGQQEKARTLGPAVRAKLGETEARVRAKAEKLMANVQSLGLPVTEKMKEKGKEIEALLKSGDFASAEKALDQLIGSTAGEATESPAPPDFSQYEAGDTDLTTLASRYEAVVSKAQQVTSLPLLRQFVHAKDALEKAKESQDVVAAGRILSWAEAELAKLP